MVRIAAEHLPRFVDDAGTAGDDQRPLGGIDPVGILDQPVAFGRVQVHAGHEKQIGDPAIQPHLGRTEVAVPLLQHDPRLAESGIRQGRTDRAHAGGDHPQIGIDEGQDPGAVVKGTGDHGRQIVPRRQAAKTLPDGRHFARRQQDISGRATR
jgi:hypothetical protein